MVDAEDPLLAGIAGQLVVELQGRVQVVAERFLDHNPLPAGLVVPAQQAGPMHLLDDLPELAGHDGKVKEDVPAQWRAAKRAELPLQFRVSRRIGEVAPAIDDVLREVPPDRFIDRLGAGKLVQRLPQLLPPGGIGLLAARDANDAEIRRHLLLFAQVIQGRDELAGSQIAAGPENHDGARFRQFARLPQAAGHEIVKFRPFSLVHSRNIARNCRRISTLPVGDDVRSLCSMALRGEQALALPAERLLTSSPQWLAENLALAQR